MTASLLNVAGASSGRPLTRSDIGGAGVDYRRSDPRFIQKWSRTIQYLVAMDLGSKKTAEAASSAMMHRALKAIEADGELYGRIMNEYPQIHLLIENALRQRQRELQRSGVVVF